MDREIEERARGSGAGQDDRLDSTDDVRDADAQRVKEEVMPRSLPHPRLCPQCACFFSGFIPILPHVRAGEQAARQHPEHHAHHGAIEQLRRLCSGGAKQSPRMQRARALPPRPPHTSSPQDLETMSREMELWVRDAQVQQQRYDDERRKTDVELEPLLIKLQVCRHVSRSL